MKIIFYFLTFILAVFLSPSWSYSYDAHLPISNHINLVFESQNQRYDGGSNFCYRCVPSADESLREKTQNGSFFAFEVSLLEQSNLVLVCDRVEHVQGLLQIPKLINWG